MYHQLAIRFVILTLLSGYLANWSHGLRIKSVQVPAAVTNGSQVSLICLFDLEKDQLYSVKWYRNYVEFYRFQPDQADLVGPRGKPPAPGGYEDISEPHNKTTSDDNYATSYQNDDDNSAFKKEFELEGINLNLQKSNASHVYLRQVTLASDGTYKCEVSSDSPSFVTVSAERQMKVYALPKNKLTILENLDRDQIKLGSTVTSPTTTNRLNHQQANQRTSNNQISKYQLNDLVNLTCVSSASYPPAQLTWFINERPVIIEPRSIFQNHFQLISSRINNLNQRSVPVESRLTISFRLDPKLLAQLSSEQSPKSTPSKQPTQSIHVHGFNLINLICKARLRISYQSEASILLSNGQTISPNFFNHKIKQQQQTDLRQLPKPSSLSSHSPGLDTSELGVSAMVLNNEVNYKWPTQSRLNSTSQHQLIRNFLLDSHQAEQQQHQQSSQVVLLVGQQQHFSPGGAGAAASGIHQSFRWNKLEFQDQVNQINSVLYHMRPNELESPIIEASSVQWMPTLARTQEAPSDQSMQPDFDATSTADPDQAAPPINQNNVQKLTCNPRKSRFQSSPNEQPQLLATSQDGDAWFKSGNHDDDDSALLNFKWLLNKQELKTNEVNVFDKLRGFYYLPAKTTATTSQPTTTTSSLSFVSPGDVGYVTRSDADVDEARGRRGSWRTRQMEMTRATDSNDHHDQRSPLTSPSTSMRDLQRRANINKYSGDRLTSGVDADKVQPGDKNNNNNHTIYIESSASILQLKELEVVCQTIIEQTIIEYETKVAIVYNLNDFYNNNNHQVNNPQIARGYQSPTSRIRAPQLDPTKMVRNKHRINNNRQFAPPAAASLATRSQLPTNIHILSTLMMILYITLINILHFR